MSELGIKNIELISVEVSSLDNETLYQYGPNTVFKIEPNENETFIDDGETNLKLYYYQGE